MRDVRDQMTKLLAQQANQRAHLLEGTPRRVPNLPSMTATDEHTSVKARLEGFLAGLPLTARVRLDPVLMSVGFKFRFR